MLLGYVLLGLTTLFWLGLVSMSLSKPPGGDNAMGYGLMLFILGIGFALTHLGLTLRIAWKGGFDGFLPNSDLRIPVAIGLTLATASTIFFCVVFKWEWPQANNPYPIFLRWLASANAHIWIGILLIVSYWFLLNSTQRSGELLGWFKGAFLISVGFCVLYGAGLLVGYFRNSAQNFQQQMAAQKAQDDKWHQKILDDIAAHQPTDPISGLLSQTWKMRPDDTRAAALAKLHAHPQWEADLLALLKDKNAYLETYYYLDGNSLAHPALFLQPLNQSLVWLAESVKKEIQTSNNLQHWTMEHYNIGQALAAIDQHFPQQSETFVPNVARLHEALTTTPPEPFKGGKFDDTPTVEQWLRRHQKK